MGWASEAATGLVEHAADVVGWPVPLVVGAEDVGGAGDGVALASTAPELPGGRFELGSVTKTITATLLALAVLDGHLSLDAPIERWLDAGPHGDLTLLELATHTSGLPRLAPNAIEREGFVADDPYIGFTAELAEVGLRSAVLEGRGEETYSNFGFQLLGLVLERATGRAYADLLRGELAEPLGADGLDVWGGPAVVDGHAARTPVARWTGELPGHGGVVGRVDDALRWARANLDPPTERLAAAIALAHGGAGPLLAWQRTADGVLWHNGGTYGFHTMLAIDPATSRALVALAADGKARQVDGAVLRLLAGDDPSSLALGAATEDHHAACRPHLDRWVAGDWSALVAGSGAGLAEALTAAEGIQGELEAEHGPVTAWRLDRGRGGEGADVFVRGAFVHDRAEVPFEATVDRAGVLVGLLLPS